jgi:phosphotriesterase-related protein
MKKVMTVLGPVNLEDLGITSTHEHLLADGSWSYDGGRFRPPGTLPDSQYDDVDVMIEEVRHFRAAGGRTIVELTSRGLKQDAAGLRRISQASGVQIVAATGFYRECVYPEYVKQETIEQLARRMMDDIAYGIEGTDVRPGIIAELATEFQAPGLSPAEEKVFRAAARASLATGLAISTHCWEGGLGLKQIQTLEDEGARADRIVIGHLAVRGGTMDQAIRIADQGVFLGIDTIGYSNEMYKAYCPEKYDAEDQANMVKDLIERGYLRQITLAQDMLRKSFLKRNDGHGYDHLLRSFLPLLKERGVTDEEIRVMLVENPRRVLAGDEPSFEREDR